MPSALLKSLALGLATGSLALAAPVQKRAVAYTDPSLSGGSMLDSSGGLGEPLNVGVRSLRVHLFRLILDYNHQF